MTDLHALLEEVADRVPDAVPPPFEAITARIRRRRMRLITGAGAATIVVIGAAVIAWMLAGAERAALDLGPGGVGVSPTASPLPGAQVVIPLTKPVTVDGAGTQTVDLGTPPSGATDIDVELSCLSAGTFYFADGASVGCSDGDVGRPPARYQLPLRPGQHSTTISAATGQRWRLVATYAKVTTSAWGTNADGLTYGVADAHGTPDLVAVTATNGKAGYVYAKDLAEPTPANPSQAVQQQNSPVITIHLPVYEADGKTKIGQFDVQRHTA
ncbi:hypothetical protein [Dactylosporangium sp. NPDC048998]|uniref:hypothetical protein n=1 Tax=Dactylosporangium sp. NPDC048998 TaxID=3363976 RepID=UPI00371F7851